MEEPTGVEEYLAALPAEPRAALERLRRVIRAAAPDATEGISYGVPAFKHRGRPLVAYAAFRDHCSFFPMSTRVIEAHAEELRPYRPSKGTIRFPADRPLPVPLVKRLVRARLAEVAASGRASTNRGGAGRPGGIATR